MKLFRIPELAAARAQQSADAVYAIVTEEGAVDLGTQWPALHYVLSSEAPMPRHVALDEGLEWDDDSLENVLMGGEPTPYADALTVARVLLPSSVGTLANKLRAVGDIRADVDDSVDEYFLGDLSATEEVATIVGLYERVAGCFALASDAGEAILLYTPG